MVKIIIGGEPVAKGRPRVTRRGFVYTPAKTRKFESHARLCAQLAMDGKPPLSVPVRAEVTVDLPVPASWSGKRREAALRGERGPIPTTTSRARSTPSTALSSRTTASSSLSSPSRNTR